MLDKIIVAPEKVRGLGNIVSPKTSSNFTNYDSSITTGSETINEVQYTVYELSYDGSTFYLTITSQYVPSGSTVTLTATLTDSEGEPVEGASIELFKEIE